MPATVFSSYATTGLILGGDDLFFMEAGALVGRLG
jgi:hypothetical protein